MIFYYMDIFPIYRNLQPRLFIDNDGKPRRWELKEFLTGRIPSVLTKLEARMSWGMV